VRYIVLVMCAMGGVEHDYQRLSATNLRLYREGV
jgi:hypothetical protein